MGKTVLAIVAVAVAVAIVVFAPEIGLALGTALGISTTTAIAIVTTVAGIAMSLALNFAAKALGIGAPSAKDAVGPPQVFRQAVSNSFIIYGKRRAGGLLAFFHSKVVGNDHYRYFVIACAGHRCKQVAQWRLGDEVVTVDGSGMVTSGKYAGACWLKFYRGTDSDIADPTFVAECGGKWTTDHKGLGVAKIYAKFKMTDAVVQAGMPNMTADIEGRDEIRDPRDATLKYTNNGPLVFYDFMAMPREEGGYGAYEGEIPDDSWISAQANVADEIVAGEARYAIDGVIQTGAPPGDLRDALIVNMAGTYAYSGGKHLMRPGYWVPSSGILSEDDLAGPIQVSPFLASDMAATEVSGTFVDPAAGYQGAPFPTWKRTPAAADVKQNDLDLAFITSVKRAQRVAAIMGKRAECEKTVVWAMNISGIKVRAMDTWQLGTTRYGLNNYAWVVANWGLTHDPDAGPGVLTHLREENAEIYEDPVPAAPSSPPAIVQPSGPLRTLEEVQTILRSTYVRGIDPLAAADAGTNASITISGTSPVFDYPGDLADVAITNLPVTIGGLAFSTTYYAYCDVDDIGDATPSFGVTTVYGDALNSSAHPYRVPLNQQVTTPADGGGGTSGGGSGGGYGGGGYGGPIP